MGTSDEKGYNMDHSPIKETKDTVIDIDSCVGPTPSDDKVAPAVTFPVTDTPLSLSCPTNAVDEFSPNKNKKEKRKSMSAKKPPRPPRGFSLDAADQKLIKEISELAMIKRARIERMKALKKMKAAKAAAAGTASSMGNLIAVVFTVIFCLVIVFQGCHSSGISPTNNSAVPVPGSLDLTRVTESNTVAVHDKWDLSPSGVPLTSVESPNLKELISISDGKNEVKKGAH